MRKQTLCILFLWIKFFVFDVSAQVPGYQGKRLFAEFTLSGWFNSSNPIANNQGPHRFPDGPLEGAFTIQEHYGGSINYVLSRKIILSAGYEYSKTGLRIRADWNPKNSYIIHEIRTPSRLVYGLEDLHTLFYNLTTHNIAISAQHYLRPSANLAPLGWYVKWGLNIVLVHGELLDQKVHYGHNENFNNHQPSPQYTNPTGINPNTFMIGAHAAFGFRTVLFDRLILSTAIQTTLFPQAMVQHRVLRTAGYVAANNVTYRSRAYQRTQMHHYLNIILSVGVLIY